MGTELEERLVERMLAVLGPRKLLAVLWQDRKLVPGCTVGELATQAKEEGWHRVLAELPLVDLVALLRTPRSKVERDQRRHQTVEDRVASVLDYVATHPGCRIGDVREELRLTRNMADRAMLVLRKRGQIVMQGTKGATRYYMPTDVPNLS